MNAKGFLVFVNKEADITLSHSPIALLLNYAYIKVKRIRSIWGQILMTYKCIYKNWSWAT